MEKELAYTDPFVSPCICGYHRRCNPSDHSLEVIKLRDEGYADRLKAKWGKLGKQVAVDHIIELWEVRMAYFRAMQLLETPEGQTQVQKAMNDSASSFGLPNVGVDVCMPKSESQRLIVLSNLRFFFNSEENLCLIDSKFNLKKNKFLDQDRYASDTDGATKPIRDLLRSYYIATEEMRKQTLLMLLAEYKKGGNLVYALIREFLISNYTNFVAECGTDFSDEVFEIVRPKFTFLPTSTMSKETRGQVLDAALNELMDIMPLAEWDELESEKAKSSKKK